MTDSANKVLHHSALVLLGLVLATGALAYTLPVPKPGPPAPPPQQIEIVPTNAAAEQFTVTCKARTEDDGITFNVRVGLKRSSRLLRCWLMIFDGTNVTVACPLEVSFTTLRDTAIYNFLVYRKYLANKKFATVFEDSGDLSGSKDYWFWLESFAQTNGTIKQP